MTTNEISIKRDVLEIQWNYTLGKAKAATEQNKNLNSFLLTLEGKFHDASRKMLEGGTHITVKAIKNALLGKKESSLMLLEIFQKHNNELSILLGQEYAQGTLKRYQTSFPHTQGCGNSKRPGKSFRAIYLQLRIQIPQTDNKIDIRDQGNDLTLDKYL